MTPDDLKQLAKDIVAGHVFTDRQAGSDIGMVFMPLSLMESEDLNELMVKLGDRGLIYEYMDKAGSLAINGKPIFMSCRYVKTDQIDELQAYIDRVREALEAI